VLGLEWHPFRGNEWAGESQGKAFRGPHGAITQRLSRHGLIHGWAGQSRKAQWNAIAAGDFAQCQADSVITTRQTIQPQILCDITMDPVMFNVCNQRNDQNAKAAEQLRGDLLLGCMARRGWAWEPD
jgi:hypothetical protein